MSYSTDISDLFEVKRELLPVTARWKHVGLALGLNPNTLDAIERENKDSENCLARMLTLWLKKNYNTERFGEPSWELLAKAVRDPAGGNDTEQAEKINNEYRG